ncbi:MAG: plastocyanin/azurin family copper-binding protein [Nitrososphaera sp.]|jgi:predicted secreted protein with PEFG-CTERM motif
MNRNTTLAAGLVAVFAAAIILPTQSAFAATINAEIVKNAANLQDKAYSPNPIKAKPGDTVVWTNKDTAIHTVTSGSASTPDNKFGTTADGSPVLISPNKTFQFTFADAGEYPYFCQLHPTMVGTVSVSAEGGGDNNGGEETEKSIDVAGPGGEAFKVISKSAGGHATKVTIMPNDKMVKVDFDGAGDVELTLPNAMISGINAVTTADGKTVQFQQTSSTASDTTIKFTVPSGATSVNIAGATVVPEFGVIAALVLAVSLVAVIGFARFKGSSFGLGRF